VSANPQYRFRTFSPEGGFDYNGISSIRQDSEGTIWFVTDKNLCRFDGYEHRNYNSSFGRFDSDRVKTRCFNGVETDRAGNVFVGSNRGLFVYDRANDSFARISGKTATALHVDRRDRLWVVLDGELNVRDSSGIRRCLFEGASLSGTVVSFAEDETGLFVASLHAVYRCGYDSKTFSVYLRLDPGAEIQSISHRDGKLWVLAANRGLLKIDVSTAAVEREYDFFHRENGGNVLTKMICADSRGAVWIATQQGLYVLDPATEQHARHLHSGANQFGLPNNSVWHIYEDRRQNIWLGTYSGGLCYMNPNEREWLENFAPDESPLNSKVVSGFAESDDALWIATEGGGANRMDKRSGEFTYLTAAANGEGLSHNNVKSLVADGERRLWIAMFRGGLDCYDMRSGKFRHFKHNPRDTNSLVTNDLRKILPAGDSGLWIIYQTGSVVVSFYSFASAAFAHYRLNAAYEFIHDACLRENKLWLAGENLYSLDLDTKETARFSLDSGPLNGQSICFDGNGDLWIGTIGCGLVRFNVETAEFAVRDEILKWNAYSAFSIVADGNSLWAGTNNGLFRYETNTGEYRRFNRHDGIRGHGFYPLAAFRSEAGKLYFGGMNGFTQFDPNLLRRNEQKPEAIVSQFHVDDLVLTPEGAMKRDDGTSAGQIVLRYNQSGFGFRFSSDSYLTPEKNRYRYRLKGYDDKWTEVGATERSAFFFRVPAGEYVFEVLAANSDGLWGDAPAQIRIRRLSAPWFSLTAWCLYVAALVATVVLVVRFYDKRKNLEMQLYLEAVDKEKKEELHRAQMRFFTNVSHDFRTPLFLIMAVLDKLRNGGEWSPDCGSILDNNANRLLNLVNELMDFRTIENGKMPLRVCPTDVNRLVRTLAYDFKNIAAQKDIEFRIVCDENLPPLLHADRNVLEKIILNLLNNAFKYTERGGEVTVETHAAREGFVARHANSFAVSGDTVADRNFLLVVRDTGTGISKESIKDVFERFYKVNTANFDSHLGAGIGLALVKSLVLLHKGALTIYSERGVGTDMAVQLPLDPAFYDPAFYDVAETVCNPSCNELEYSKLPPPINSGTDSVRSSGNKLFPTKRRILLVEDNDELRRLIADSLSDEFEVSEAGNGAVACEMLKTAEPDMIISDILMPEMDGISLCRAVKGDIALSHVPLVLLTAKTGVESRLEGADSGADLYFEKPVDLRLLRASIHNLFNLRKNLREHYAKNYFADTSKLAFNQRDKEFLERLADITEKNLDRSEIDIAYIASELGVSRAKLYNKVKGLTGKSTMEFILSCRLKKAAALLLESELSIKEVMDRVGIESQSYFTSAFKKEFGETPAAFAKKLRIKN
jgi:signal transduction histidine kinase/ligand-binding sensor domain-containing protein/DNA-binding response OmpR family regulator